MAPVLRDFDLERAVIIETDASDYVSAGVLSQHDDGGVLHPVAYCSEKHIPAEWDYDIYDKELLASIKALEEWRPKCEGAAYLLRLLTDYKNLEWYVTKKLLNRQQALWSEFLARCDYQILYRPGKSNGRADALTRRPGDLPEWGDEQLKNIEQVVRKPQNLPEQLSSLVDSPPAQGQPSISDLLIKAYGTDPLPGKILEAIRTNSSVRVISIAECMEKDGQVYYTGGLYVPEDNTVHIWIIQ